ncbi:hypothetical protein AB0E69_37075 [Kribbella sp. NPDC026611]|uniref:hypothetical protein n=1 Tax=Kribbella sp. NPDC026611 TaxID=3154911 RepID=UPI0033EFD324
MLTLSTAALLSVTLLTPPTPITWQETPTGIPLGVVFRLDQSGGQRWAVGIDIEQTGPRDTTWHPLALRWNGTSWERTVSAFPNGRLDDVLVRGADDVWAAGSAEGPGGWSEPYLEHWDGSVWHEVQTPAGRLSGLIALDQDDEGNLLVADSDAKIHRYDGRTWQDLPPAGDLWIEDLQPLGGKELLAAGGGGIMRFDGSRWQQIELPEGTADISRLLVRGPGDIWAVGHKNSDQLWRVPLAVHYDGSRWSEVPTPVVTGELHSIEAVGNRLIAVGGVPFDNKPLVMEFDGDKFVATTPPPGATYLHGSSTANGCLWVTGTGPAGAEPTPYVGVAAGLPDAGTGFPPKSCG